MEFYSIVSTDGKHYEKGDLKSHKINKRHSSGLSSKESNSHSFTCRIEANGNFAPILKITSDCISYGAYTFITLCKLYTLIEI